MAVRNSRAFAPGGEDPKTLKPLKSYLNWCHLLTVYTPKKKSNQSPQKTRSPMHLIYNFFSGFCKSPPKIKQKSES
jgi:hypothetical protein